MAHEDIAAFPVIAEDDLYVVRLLPYGNEWMTGDIQGQDYTGREDERAAMAGAVLKSMTTVAPANRNGSTCTDGRDRVELADGTSPVDAMEMVVGASAVTAFRVAESRGDKFFPDMNWPVARRIRYTHDFLKANGEQPRTHEACGAAAGMLAVQSNEIIFGRNSNFRSRMAALMPAGLYDGELHDVDLEGLDRRTAMGLYAGYASELIVASVIDTNGLKAVERLLDDGTGVHGHNEAAIVMKNARIKGVAISPNTLSAITGGGQVFGVNGSKKEDLALLFSNGGQDEEAYTQAWHAATSFGAAGHGTLGRGHETWLMDLKAA